MYWDEVSTFFSDNPYVIGFDPINEPAPTGNGLGSLIYNLLPGNFDRYVLASLYEKLF